MNGPPKFLKPQRGGIDGDVFLNDWAYAISPYNSKEEELVKLSLF
jgi:hypothetical protein